MRIPPRQRGILLYFAKRYRSYSLIVFGTCLGTMVFEVAGVLAVFPFLSSLLGSSPPSQALGFAGKIFASLLKWLPLPSVLLNACLLILVLSMLQAASRILNGYFNSKAFSMILYDLQNSIMRNYSMAPYEFFLNTRLGRHNRNLFGAVYLTAGVVPKMSQCVGECIRAAALIGLVCWLDFRAALVLGILLLLFEVVVIKQGGKWVYALGHRMNELDSESRAIAQEYFTGIRSLLVFGEWKNWLAKFDRKTREFADASWKAGTLQELTRPILEAVVLSTVFGSILAIGLIRPDSLTQRLPFLGTVAAAALRLLPSFTSFSRKRMEIFGALPMAEMTYEAASGESPRRTGRSLRCPPLAQGIRLEQVHFQYDGRRQTLKDVTLEFPVRSFTLVLGGSGSGKTTLLNLILGLYAPTAGRVLIDGIDLRDLDPQTWHGRVALVSQDPFLFHSTIAENITLGREAFTREEIEGAAKIARIHEFIASLPNGYDTVIGERGMKLSGGQQQLIEIARAMLRNPEVLILDEPTSSLDFISEAEVLAAVKAVAAGRTTILSADRLATIAPVDQVLALNDGGVQVRNPRRDQKIHT